MKKQTYHAPQLEILSLELFSNFAASDIALSLDATLDGGTAGDAFATEP